MAGIKTKSTRRAFFMSGGAVLGAGVATAVAASAVDAAKPAATTEEQLKQLRQQLEGAHDREAIRQLHLAFTTHVENRKFDAAAELFDEHAHLRLSGMSASGKPAIRKLFADLAREQGASAVHSAYRQNTAQQRDAVTLSEDRMQATATFHVEVELCTPLQGDCTVAQMARLQGHVADRRWEAGRFEAKYVKTLDQWKVASLSYLPA